MCAQLGMTMMAGDSPQAKGRVELKNGVHEDRFIKKMRRKGIASYAAANAYLKEYLLAMNQRFGRTPASPRNYHRATPSLAELHAAFRLETKRSISNDWVVRYHGRYLQLSPSSRRYAPRQGAVLVYESEDGKLEVHYRGEPIAHQEISAPVRPENPPAALHVPYSRPLYPHGPEHPYKRHADRQIKRQRLRQLKQAVAARAVAEACAAPHPAAGTPAPGPAPAPPKDTPFSPQPTEKRELFK